MVPVCEYYAEVSAFICLPAFCEELPHHIEDTEDPPSWIHPRKKTLGQSIGLVGQPVRLAVYGPLKFVAQLIIISHQGAREQSVTHRRPDDVYTREMRMRLRAKSI